MPSPEEVSRAVLAHAMSRAKTDAERAEVQARCDTSGITLDTSDEPSNILREGETLVRTDLACSCTPDACDCRAIEPGAVDTTGARVDRADASDQVSPPMLGGIKLDRARAWLGASRVHDLTEEAGNEQRQRAAVSSGAPTDSIYRDLMLETIRAADPQLADRLERSVPTTDALRVIYSELPDPTESKTDMSIDSDLDNELARARRRSNFRLQNQWTGETVAQLDARFDALEAGTRNDATDNDADQARARALRSHATRYAAGDAKELEKANARFDAQLEREASAAQFRAGKVQTRADAAAVPLTGKAPNGITESGKWPQGDDGDHESRQIARQNARQNFLLANSWRLTADEKRQLMIKWQQEDLDDGPFQPSAA